MNISPSKNLPFERRYPRETIERVKAELRSIIVLKAAGAVMPSYRAISKYLQDNYLVNISGTTVKRLIEKLDRAGMITEIAQRATGA